jgi:signal transduction histidine kinase
MRTIIRKICEALEWFIDRIKKFVYKRSVLSIIFVYYFITITIATAFYPLIPMLLNYPPNNEEVSSRLGTSNILQYIVILFLALFIGTIFFVKALRGINSWEKLDKNSFEDTKKLYDIRKKCINLPYLIFIGQILLTSLPIIPILFTVALLNKISLLIPMKIITIVITVFSLAAVVSHVFSKGIFKMILLKTYFGGEIEGKRISIKNKIFIQIVPIIVISMLITAFLGYSKLIEEKGNLLYMMYKSTLTNNLKSIDLKDSDQTMRLLKSMNLDDSRIVYYTYSPNGTVVTSDGSSLSEYLLYYIKNPYASDRIFDANIGTQGIVVKLNGDGGEWKLGIIFDVASKQLVIYFFISFITLLALNIFVLYYFSKSLAGEISLIAESLNDIAEGDHVDLDRKIAVVSNDELADLVIAFNKIQEREKEHIREIEEKHAIIIEQERLATLGHLIGGIAHNLRTPIMSISGVIEGLKDLVAEYDESIGDSKVTQEDHHEIAKEMNVWLEKMRPYCAYMSDIIMAVKGQTMQRSNEEGLNFTLDELNKRIVILFEYELKKQHCKLNSVYNINMRTKINGDISDMVQVLNNLIVNAVDSYEGNGGNIDLIVNGSDKVIEFIVRDFGKGIPIGVQERLFKEMITTKGKNGTGLGLYMSYSNLKARFGGKMRFETEDGKGTTFYIYIPVEIIKE